MIIFLLSCLHFAAPAQVIIAFLFGDKLNTGKTAFGIMVSPAITNISNLESDARAGWNLGLYLDLHPDRSFYLHIEGVAKGSFGAKGIKPYVTGSDTLDYLFANGSVERKIKTFGLPVLLRYKISSLFFAEAGLQADMRLKAQDVFKADVQGNDLEYRVPVTQELTWLDLGIAGGLFYRLSKKKTSMGLGIRYFRGLTDTYKPMTGNQVNSAWILNVAIPIGAGRVRDER